MSSDQIERKLKAVPVRTLSAEADTEIVAAIRAAAGEARPWYLRPVPLWQAAAACLVLCVATWLVGTTGRVSTAPPVDTGVAAESRNVVVRLDKPLFREVSLPVDRVNVSRWQFCISPVTE